MNAHPNLQPGARPRLTEPRANVQIKCDQQLLRDVEARLGTRLSIQEWIRMKLYDFAYPED